MIPDDLAQQILRLHFVEGWKVGTIADQVRVHHTTVRRVLDSQGIAPRLDPRPSIADPYLPFILETLEKWPTLPASRLYAMVVDRGYPGKAGHFRRARSTHSRSPPAAQARRGLRASVHPAG